MLESDNEELGLHGDRDVEVGDKALQDGAGVCKLSGGGGEKWHQNVGPISR